jgi:hypothetical protein
VATASGSAPASSIARISAAEPRPSSFQGKRVSPSLSRGLTSSRVASRRSSIAVTVHCG